MALCSALILISNISGEVIFHNSEISVPLLHILSIESCCLRFLVVFFLVYEQEIELDLPSTPLCSQIVTSCWIKTYKFNCTLSSFLSSFLVPVIFDVSEAYLFLAFHLFNFFRFQTLDWCDELYCQL